MRKSQIGIGLSAVVILGLAVLFYPGAEPIEAQAATVDRELAALLPPGATALVGVDVERIKMTPVYLYLDEEARREGNQKLDEFAARTGFDPRRDVERLLVALWDPATSGVLTDPKFLAVARGRFDVDRLRQEVESRAEPMDYRGFTIYRFAEKSAEAKEDAPPRMRSGARHGSASLSFLDESTVLFGSEAMLPAAIDLRAAGGAGGAANEELLDRAEAMASSNQVWVVSERTRDLLEGGLPEGIPPEHAEFVRILRSMQSTSFALDLMQGLQLEAEGLCQSVEDAKTLGDAARGLVALGRLSTASKNQELMRLFDRIQISEQEASLHVSLKLDAAEFEQMMEALKARKRPAETAERL